MNPYNLRVQLVDKQVTDFVSEYFGKQLPTLDGKYGVTDTTIQLAKAFTIYFQENGLLQGITKKMIKLDEPLKHLFGLSPTLDTFNSEKSYLALVQERIEELKNSTFSLGSPQILQENGDIYLNYPALKILLSKLVYNHSPPNPNQYMDDMNTFQYHLNNWNQQNKVV